ncbi:unnamed protein product [Blepharisma stoltei]|uniref:Kelch motif family protein n=1 Tax=Blepharisma stoltei TaxID=1481888 RepID=A0AAU9JGV6_9CILI|nr:unnamed protein product [Blepharisma stoltei]
MNVAICKIQLNKERERNEQLEKKLSKYRKKNTAKTSEIELLKEEIAHLNSIINDNKKNEKDLKDSNEELINSQRIKITQDLIKNNEAEKAQKIQELREKRFEIWNRSNGQDLEQDFRRTCSKYSSDIYADEQAYQDYTNAYRQKTSLYTIDNDLNRTNLIIYDTENDSREVRIVDTHESLDLGTCIAQLPNGNLFCFGKDSPIISGTTLIIDENYRARELPSGTHCYSSSAIYFNNSVYCFGGINNKGSITLSERFDLNKNRWTKLKSLPQADHGCKSVMFNGNIVISGYNKHLLRYSIGKNTFAKIPYDFKEFKQKILLSAERLYLIECQNGSIYESELSSDTAWRPIGDSIINSFHQIYVSYNKGGINIALIYSVVISYFKFNLEGKILTKLDEIHR